MTQAATQRCARSPISRRSTQSLARTANSGSVPTTTPALLEGPIAATLFGLAAPTVVVPVIQVGVSAAEAAFVGWLGAESARRGVPGLPPHHADADDVRRGMAGGIASAVARALGAGRRADADALAWHAFLIAVVMGTVFTTATLWSGPRLIGLGLPSTLPRRAWAGSSGLSWRDSPGC